MNISWNIEGRPLSEAELGKELLKSREVREEVLRNAKQAVKRFRCPDHGEAVTVSIGRDTSRGFQLQFDACCDTAAESAASLVGAK